MNIEALHAYPLATWREPLGVRETPAEYVFHRPRLYLETTIPSYLTARPSQDLRKLRLQKITQRWWNSWRTQFHIHVSDSVWNEVGRGDPEAARRRIVAIDRLPELKTNDSALSLRSKFLEGGGIPLKSEEDAMHMALATVHRMEFLLTWNCAHLVNPHIARRIAAICQSENFSCPIVCTPEQLLERYEYAPVSG